MRYNGILGDNISFRHSSDIRQGIAFGRLMMADQGLVIKLLLVMVWVVLGLFGPVGGAVGFSSGQEGGGRGGITARGGCFCKLLHTKGL